MRKLTLADITVREREHLELSIHEAAHAVAGVVLGAQLRNAVVTNSRLWGVDGRTNFADRPHGRDPEIAYAGPWAQARWRAGSRPSQRQVFAVLRAGGYKDDRALIAAGGTYLGTGVTPLLERCWPAVTRVAQQLHRSGEVTESDVLAALGVDDGGGRSSVQLAAIRSNCRSVPPITTKKQAVPADAKQASA
ncbi:hypothetical protein [Mycobacterium sp.]|uniref:hypothetical protein n=1 Tax=Mycobacterium sp. TaxID=1785 RepID=UPI003D6A4E44